MKLVRKFYLQKDLFLSINVPVKSDIHGWNFVIFKDRGIYVKKGFSWDGASPKTRVFGEIIGTPDFPETYHATLVHDILYRAYGNPNLQMSRIGIDRLFLKIMRQKRFKYALLWYWIVRLFGKLGYKFGKVF